jgi:phosphate transport system protein
MAAINIAGELERIGDYCNGIAKITLNMASEPAGDAYPEIREMATITEGLLLRAVAAFVERDVDAASQVWRSDDQVDDLYREFFSVQIEDMVEHRKRVRRGTYMLWVAHNIERMADRITNIAEEIAFTVTADVASWRAELESQSLPAH